MTRTRRPNSPGITATCRVCRRPVIWAVTENDKTIPLDAEPSMERGRFVKVGRVATRYGMAPKVHHLSADERRRDTRERYATHFSSDCDGDDS